MLALPLLPLLASCATVFHATKPVPTNGCEWVSPILVSKKDVLTDDTAKQILTLDKNWVANCNNGKLPAKAAE